MQILRAAEDYLEAMLMMQQKHGYIRSIDIAEQLGVTKPSVTYTTKRLRENGYITMDRDGLITLTPSGMDIAARMLDRHHTLTKFLMELGVDAKTAEEDACKMEHDISEQTYTALCRHAIGKLGILGEDDAGLGELKNKHHQKFLYQSYQKNVRLVLYIQVLLEVHLNFPLDYLPLPSKTYL